jgi:putative colanic acid biosynthesis glycosyltransferase
VYDLTIITIHLNDYDGLLRTLQSLRPILGEGNVEWNVIDGGSERHDGDILEQVASVADKLISETDHGIYDAMNKGVRIAAGDYVLFLNAGDELHSDFDPARIFREAQLHRSEMIWGSYDESGKKNRLSNIQPRKINWLWWGMPTSHQAILFRREILGSKPYNEELKMAGDYDLVLRLVNEGATIAHTTVPICVADGTGISNTQQKLALIEQMAVRKKYFGTSRIVNLSVFATHLAVAWLGRFGSVRKLWK